MDEKDKTQLVPVWVVGRGWLTVQRLLMAISRDDSAGIHRNLSLYMPAFDPKVRHAAGGAEHLQDKLYGLVVEVRVAQINQLWRAREFDSPRRE